jgi:hypothetical protein
MRERKRERDRERQITLWRETVIGRERERKGERGRERERERKRGRESGRERKRERERARRVVIGNNKITMREKFTFWLQRESRQVADSTTSTRDCHSTRDAIVSPPYCNLSFSYFTSHTSLPLCYKQQ